MNRKSSAIKVSVYVCAALTILLVVLGYQYIFRKSSLDIAMRIPSKQWRFDPSEIIVPPNTRVRLHIYNEDTFDHGFAIEQLKVDSILPPLKETIVNIPPTQLGEYEFSCDVLCGEGHSNQIGKLIVR